MGNFPFHKRQHGVTGAIDDQHKHTKLNRKNVTKGKKRIEASLWKRHHDNTFGSLVATEWSNPFSLLWCWCR